MLKKRRRWDEDENEPKPIDYSVIHVIQCSSLSILGKPAVNDESVFSFFSEVRPEP